MTCRKENTLATCSKLSKGMHFLCSRPSLSLSKKFSKERELYSGPKSLTYSTFFLVEKKKLYGSLFLHNFIVSILCQCKLAMKCKTHVAVCNFSKAKFPSKEAVLIQIQNFQHCSHFQFSNMLCRALFFF